MLVGYMRVSTAEQTMVLQHDALRGARCERVYDDMRAGCVAGGRRARCLGLTVLTDGIDTMSATGLLVFGIFVTLSKFERDLILERMMAGCRPPAADDPGHAMNSDDNDGRPDQRRSQNHISFRE